MRYLMFEPNNSDDWGSWTECNIWGLIEMWIDNFLWQKSNLFFEGCNSTTGRRSTTETIVAGCGPDNRCSRNISVSMWLCLKRGYGSVQDGAPQFCWLVYSLIIAPSKYSYDMLWVSYTMVIMVMFTNLAKYGTPSCTSNSNGLPRFQQKETVEHLVRVGDRQGSPGTPFGVVQPPQKGRNSAEKTYHDLEDENGISLIFINIS